MPPRPGSSTASRSPSPSSPTASPTSTAPISSQRAKSNSTVSSSEHVNHWTGIYFAMSVLQLVWPRSTLSHVTFPCTHSPENKSEAV